MCGRYTFVETKHLKKRFKLQNDLEDLTPRYNVAPGSLMPVITHKKENIAEVMRWGLVPHWAKDPKIGYRMINARAETLMEKPTWRKPFLSTRCLIPASGFFEWQHQNGKQPYFIHLDHEPLFAFAGLYDQWLDAENRPLNTFTIITTRANEVVGKLHDRMPVILDQKDEANWLDPDNREPDSLQKLLVPYPAAKMVTYPVSININNPKNEDESLLEKVVVE
jgi:putative SOS response-associated peptidase YedK